MSSDRESVYYGYLFRAYRNTVVFAKDTFWAGGPQPPVVWEFRRPSSVYKDILSEVLTNVDRAASVIDTWPTFYRWLSREVPREAGWAAFDTAWAKNNLPHWFGEDVRIACLMGGSGVNLSRYVDISLNREDLASIKESTDSIFGNTDDDTDLSQLSATARTLMQYSGNMAIFRRSIFEC